MYEIAIYSSPGWNSVSFEFINLDSTEFFSSDILSNIPANSVFMAPRGYHSAGGTSTVIGFCLFNLYVETDL